MESGRFVLVKESFIQTDSVSNDPSLVSVRVGVCVVFPVSWFLLGWSWVVMESGEARHCVQDLYKACPILAVNDSPGPGTTGMRSISVYTVTATQDPLLGGATLPMCATHRSPPTLTLK